jgi:pimeloyl-ACP methyl ester carboxylesterase
MDRTLLHFAHANGFPSLCYHTLFEVLTEEFDMIHIDMLAHDPRFPVDRCWETSADELINYLDQAANRPVIGIGHSFGASATFLAAVKRPDLFRGLILLEPTLINGWLKYIVRLAELVGVLGRFTPANQTKNRRRNWPDRASAEDYFRSKPLYNNFDPACFQDFLKYGLIQTDSGLSLKFEVEKEVEIFNGLPHHMDNFKGALEEMPGVIIGGDQSKASIEAVLKRLAKQQKMDLKMIKGGHLFPFEQPELTVRLIRQYAQLFS